MRSVGDITSSVMRVHNCRKSIILQWCTDNNLLLNISKTMKLIVERKKEAKTHSCVCISGAKVKQVNGFRLLGINFTENLSQK